MAIFYVRLLTCMQIINAIMFSILAAVLATNISDQYSDTTLEMDPDVDTVLVRVKGCKEARVALLVEHNQYDGAMYEIIFGANNNTRIILR
jgi:hypothetical protein